MAQNLKAEGIWKCNVLDGRFGEDNGRPFVQINVEIDEGPNKGRKCTYEDEINAKSALYAMRSARAVGFKGADWSTIATDVAKWIKETGGKSTVEIRHVEIKNGKNAGKIWDKVNSIGRAESRELKQAERNTMDDANDALRRAMADDSSGGQDEDLPF